MQLTIEPLDWRQHWLWPSQVTYDYAVRSRNLNKQFQLYPNAGYLTFSPSRGQGSWLCAVEPPFPPCSWVPAAGTAAAGPSHRCPGPPSAPPAAPQSTGPARRRSLQIILIKRYTIYKIHVWILIGSQGSDRYSIGPSEFNWIFTRFISTKFLFILFRYL